MIDAETEEKTIKYCKKPAIQEAWFVMTGKPGPEEDGTEGFITKRLRDEYPKIEPTPVFRVVQTPPPGVDANPYWTRQFSWDNGKKAGRIGHRYFSVHRICNVPTDYYAGFTTELNPEIKIWSKIADEASTKGSSMPIQELRFGYVNRFTFPLVDTFDLQTYFHLQYTYRTLEELTQRSANIEFTLSSEKHTVTLQLKTLNLPPGSEEMKVIVKAQAYNQYPNLKTSDQKRIAEELDRLHLIAKRAFFAFAKDKTKDDILETVYE